MIRFLNCEEKYKSIFISDVHLGTKASQAEKLCKFLKENTCENLYFAVKECLTIDKNKVIIDSGNWSWERCYDQFVNILLPIKNNFTNSV